jgi:hypothetical protein
MRYHGNNPLGRAIASDPDQLSSVLEAIQAHAATLQKALTSPQSPKDYQRLQSSADRIGHCVQTCTLVLTEFHAACHSVHPGARPSGRT